MPRAHRLPPFVRKLLRSQQFGLVASSSCCWRRCRCSPARTSTTRPGATINNFLNSHTLIQTATDASFVAIMAVGATIVIISGGIDLSVGSVYALAGRHDGPHPARRPAPAGGVGAVLLALVRLRRGRPRRRARSTA